MKVFIGLSPGKLVPVSVPEPRAVGEDGSIVYTGASVHFFDLELLRTVWREVYSQIREMRVPEETGIERHFRELENQWP